MRSLLRLIDRDRDREGGAVVVATITLDELAQSVDIARDHVARCEDGLSRAKLELDAAQRRFRDEDGARGLLV